MDALAEKLLTLPKGGTLAYFEGGDPSGQPVLYQHGWPGSKLQALLAFEAAKATGVRVIAMDRPGLGGSTPACGETLADVARAQLHLADHLGMERFAILGVSGGAPHAHALVHHAPERVLAVGICCGLPPPEHFRRQAGLHPLYRLLLFLERHWAGALRPLLEIFRGMLFTLTPGQLLFFARPWMASPDAIALREAKATTPLFASVRDAFRQGVPPVLNDARTLVQPWGFDPARSTRPTFFWHGEKDRNIPLASVRGLLFAMPQARLTLFEQEAHYSLPLRQTERMLTDLLSLIERKGEHR